MFPIGKFQLWATVVSISIVVALILHFSPGDFSSAKDKNQVAAMMNVFLVKKSEAHFYVNHGRYGTLQELGPAGGKLIPHEVADSAWKGYRVQLEITQNGYNLSAWPIIYETTGTASYFSDQSGVVRRSWQPEHATASSRAVD